MPQFMSDAPDRDMPGLIRPPGSGGPEVLSRLCGVAVRGVIPALAWGNKRCRACAEIFLPLDGKAGPGENEAAASRSNHNTDVHSKHNAGGGAVLNRSDARGTQAHPPLCVSCAALLGPRQAGHCSLCGQIFPNPDLSPAPCADCLRQPPPWSAFYFYAVYERLARDLFTAFKFHGDLPAGRLLASLLSLRVAPLLAADLAGEGALARDGGGAKAPLLVPVPVHKKRLQERGFNQSLLLAGPLAKTLGLPLSPRILWRTRLDPPQSSLDRKARLLGPKGAFGAHDLVSGRRIVLLDDIMTTGATLREATRTLLAQGAADVSIVVLARTSSNADTL